MAKKKRGGKRKGAGRPKTKEDTKVIRVPVSKAEGVKKLLSREDFNDIANGRD